MKVISFPGQTKELLLTAMEVKDQVMLTVQGIQNLLVLISQTITKLSVVLLLDEWTFLGLFIHSISC